MGNRHEDKANDSILIAKLNDIIEAETKKPIDQWDVDLIKECVDFLMELQGYEPLTSEELAQAETTLIQAAEQKAKPRFVKLKKQWFRAALIAACCAVALLSANIAAMTYGVNTASLLRKFSDEITDMFVGERYEKDGITIINNGKEVACDSVEKFLSDENTDVLYPTELPNRIEMKEVQIFNETNDDGVEYRYVIFNTDSPDVSLCASTKPNAGIDSTEDSYVTKKVVGTYNCFVSKDHILQYNFVHGDCFYIVKAKTHRQAIKIINNLSEIVQL